MADGVLLLAIGRNNIRIRAVGHSIAVVVLVVAGLARGGSSSGCATLRSGFVCLADKSSRAYTLADTGSAGLAFVSKVFVHRAIAVVVLGVAEFRWRRRASRNALRLIEAGSVILATPHRLLGRAVFPQTVLTGFRTASAGSGACSSKTFVRLPVAVVVKIVADFGLRNADTSIYSNIGVRNTGICQTAISTAVHDYPCIYTCIQKLAVICQATPLLTPLFRQTFPVTDSAMLRIGSEIKILISLAVTVIVATIAEFIFRCCGSHAYLIPKTVLAKLDAAFFALAQTNVAGLQFIIATNAPFVGNTIAVIILPIAIKRRTVRRCLSAFTAGILYLVVNRAVAVVIQVVADLRRWRTTRAGTP